MFPLYTLYAAKYESPNNVANDEKSDFLPPSFLAYSLNDYSGIFWKTIAPKYHITADCFGRYCNRKIAMDQTCYKIVIVRTFECSYPLEYNICHQFFNSNIITTLQISRSSKLYLDTSYMQGKKGFQIYYILEHSNFLVPQGPLQAAISQEPMRMVRGKFASAFVLIIGCIGLNLSRIGDIDVSHLFEP